MSSRRLRARVLTLAANACMAPAWAQTMAGMPPPSTPNTPPSHSDTQHDADMPEMPDMSDMPGMHDDEGARDAEASAPATMDARQHAAHMDMQHMARGALGPYPMGREASGTSWQPEASPMTGHHLASVAWQTMLHGTVTAVHTDSEGPRGGGDDFVESMFMAMGQRPLGDGVLALRGMVSLDPWLVGNDGYRLLLQTGESADGVTPLVDRQHPHDLWMELSASYAWTLSGDASLFVYAGLPGEPALGPPTYMHRASAMDDPEAPLGHHWLDATHVTFGVATVGWTWREWKLEGSAFNGREPDQHRTDIEMRALDSWSARVSWNPDPHWALQISHGALSEPERLEPGVDVDRTTASAMHLRTTTAGDWATTLAWGLNRKRPGRTTDAWLLESALARPDGWTLYGRAERVDKDELFGEDDPLHGLSFPVDKLSVGAVFDFPATSLGRLGLGGQVSRHWLPAALAPAYGTTPDAWLLFARWKL